MSSGWVICLCNSLKKIGTAKNAAFHKFIMKKMQIFKASFKLWIMQRNVIYATSIFPLFPSYLLLSTLGRITGGFTCALDESECMAHLQMGSLTGVGSLHSLPPPPLQVPSVYLGSPRGDAVAPPGWGNPEPERGPPGGRARPGGWKGAVEVILYAAPTWVQFGCFAVYIYQMELHICAFSHCQCHLRSWINCQTTLDQTMLVDAWRSRASLWSWKLSPPPKFHNPQTIYPH